MRKKYTFSILIFSLAVLFECGAVFAQSADFTGSAGSDISGTYTVIMKRVEISTDGTSWVTLGDTQTSFNIASGDAGATIGTFISNASIPVGTYTRLRATQSRRITIKGRSGAQGGNYYYTTTANGIHSGSGMYLAGAVAVASWPPADYEGVDFQVPADATGQPGETLVISGDDMIMTKDLSGDPIVISEGATLPMSLSFDTQNMIGFQSVGSGNYIFFPMAPRQTYAD